MNEGQLKRQSLCQDLSFLIAQLDFQHPHIKEHLKRQRDKTREKKKKKKKGNVASLILYSTPILSCHCVLTEKKTTNSYGF